MSTLYEISNNYMQALNELSSQDDIEQPLITDTLEAIEGELTVKMTNVLAYALNLDAEAEQIAQAEKRMKERRQSIEKRSQWMHDYLLVNMQKCGITEIKANDGSFRARLMQGRESVLIEDENALPHDCTRTKVICEADKVEIKKRLSAGEMVPGAKLQRKPQLKID